MPTSYPSSPHLISKFDREQLTPAWTWRRRLRRVPFVRECDVDQSGAACLAMVLAWLGKPGMLSRCRVACDPGRDGLTPEDLMCGASLLGLHANDWVIQGADAFDVCRLPLPAIVFWEGRQFVIVEHVARRRVTIVDPACGRRRLSREEFDRCCSGVALTFALDDNTSPRDVNHMKSSVDGGHGIRGWLSSSRDLLREVCEVQDGPWTIGALLVATIALQFCSLGVPVAVLFVVDHMLTGALEQQVVLLATAGLLVAASHTLLSFVRSEALSHLRTSAGARSLHRMVSRRVHLPFHVGSRRMATDLHASVGDLNALHGDVATWTIVAWLDGWRVVFMWVMVAVWSPVLAAVAGGLGLLQIVVLVWADRRLRTAIEREVAADADGQACLTQILRGLSDVKAAGREGRVMERWSDLVARWLELVGARQRVESQVGALGLGMALCSLLGLLVIGAHEVLAGRLSLGLMLALNVLAAGAWIPLGEITRSRLRFLIARARCERLRGVLEPLSGDPSKRRGDTGETTTGDVALGGVGVSVPLRVQLTGAVRVERLCVRYQHGGPLVLDEVSFAAGSGELVVIVGRAGSGKSTLARVLAGLQMPSAGRVLLDRWPLPSLDRWQAREQCGVVLPESRLFNQTVRENIAFGRSDLSFEQIVRAARVAAVHDEIMRMPLGYDTPVLGAGDGLSGSERQRLLIARAVVDRPALLILDEAMCQLDADIEARVASNLAELHCTRIVIGHRVSMVRDANLVLVLERGRVVEQGSPEMLVKHRGLVAGLPTPGHGDCEGWR